ncbi:type II toxin-antitoxin system prevent-host-death family antitoxin [Thiocapsa sp.]|uniref:type II toxin-antitoxin system Phd/YefM family antitoxin n=1 Tax=Thiocapsa sp. TaxID=2024551 RepID=UPI002D07EC4D|nr:type II toxin-antitoxin system prevent-host-death family antitoxin [Thiocapsa sp.]HSO84089.1 type II toxin-antitoxin system prevent-host-death family antitoxin [Thiocapsa sp.]
MQVNMLEARNQLSKLVKAALAGDEVIIACNGEAQVRLVPCMPSSGLRGWGAWGSRSVDVDEAFTEEADAEVGRLFGKS